MTKIAEEIDRSTIQLITPDQAWHYKVVPFAFGENELSVYVNGDEVNASELEFITGFKISVQQIENNELVRLLNHYYRRAKDQKKNASNIEFEDFLQDLISEAKSLDSSDIHIETFDEMARIRIRVDGHLIEKYALKKTEYPELINKIKILSNLDITEKRLPQDGRIKYENGNQKFDIRVSICPTLYGEKAVLRLLNNDASNLDIKNIGINPNGLKHYLEGIHKPSGIVLISGPTGSGKTTTLYATLKELNKINRNITTVEDPVEYTLDGINQVQLKEDIGLTFSSALRSFLRQDPDIIMLGEIRDGETAEMAIRASLTGHLVLSTIHTNSAWGIISRLIDMGVPKFLISSTLNLAVAQRLVRKLCEHCTTSERVSNDMLGGRFLADEGIQEIAIPVGCDSCHYTGYSGRMAIHEIIPINEVLRKVIVNDGEPDEELKRLKIDTLKSEAFNLLKNKKTSLEEVYGIISEV